MRLAIRDDDTNFFTTPAELEACYKGIWEYLPPTLCLISKVKGNWNYWVHQIYKDRQNTNWEAWSNDDSVHPLEDNVELVAFIQDYLAQGKCDIGFHAKYHRNEDGDRPKEVFNNYVRGAEFYTNRDMTATIKAEVAHLNALFNYSISVFTPPQNLLSVQGYNAIIKAGLNLCGGGLPFYKKQKDVNGLLNFGRQLFFKAINPGKDFPYVLRFSDHNEIVYHYPLQPDTQMKTLIDAFENVRSFDGDFVLSTHYVEFNYPMSYDPSRTMKNILEDFLDYTSRYNIKYTSLTDLLK